MSRTTDARSCHRSFLGLAGAGMIVLLGAGIAWACIPQARLVSLRPVSSGPPGMSVTVDGLALDGGPNEVRWSSPDGPKLASATGPNFSVSVTIPDVPVGLYGLYVISRLRDGSIGNAASAAFQVTAPGGQDAVDTPPGRSSPGTSEVGTGIGHDDPKSSSSSSGPGAAATASVGGAGLVVGGLAGALITRRRKVGTGSAGS